MIYACYFLHHAHILAQMETFGGETNNWRILLPNQELAVVCSLFAWFLTSRFGLPGEAFIALDLLLLLRLPVDLSLELVCLII